MKISSITLRGFRNFKNATINLESKSLIIGANDVGKTNLLYALRMLLDRNLSEQAIEPKDSDFYVYDETNEFIITIKFSDVSENVRVQFRESVSDNGELFLRYRASRNPDTNKKTYQILAGCDLDTLEESYKSKYTKALKIRYISSYRDLYSYIKRERRALMEEAKEVRPDAEIGEDDSITLTVKDKINEINTEIAKLNYIKKATQSINTELDKLSFHHSNHNIVFSIGGYDIQSFIDNAQLSSIVNGKSVNIGGDGRNNQIFLALWAAKNILESDPSVTNIFAIEEPEAHLHPQQERKIAQYLIDEIKSQVILTSHSPHILSMFSPNSIVRLFQYQSETKVAKNGCSKIIDDALVNFGYRKSIISAEAFFANVVFLVEGASEVVFYNALGNRIVDLDKYNISILMADGVGFQYYIDILKALEIPFVLRTDNDIFKIPRSNPERYRMAGVQRAIGFSEETPELKDLKDEKKSYLSGFDNIVPPKNIVDISNEFKALLINQNIYVANQDLENDLINSGCFDEVSAYFGGEIHKNIIINKMQKSKATFMFDFLLKHSTCLDKLINHNIAEPIKRCKEIAEEIITKSIISE